MLVCERRMDHVSAQEVEKALREKLGMSKEAFCMFAE